MAITIITKLFLIAYLFISFVSMGFLGLSILSQFLGGAPFVTTPAPVMDEMMQLAEIKEGEKVYDLGCGDGRLLIEANKLFGAKATGIELSPVFYWLAKERSRFSGADVALVRGNIFDFDFSDADVVFCHLMPMPMKRLESKFRNLQKGTRIISLRFEIPGWEPLVHIKRDQKRKLPPVFKYQV